MAVVDRPSNIGAMQGPPLAWPGQGQLAAQDRQAQEQIPQVLDFGHKKVMVLPKDGDVVMCDRPDQIMAAHHRRAGAWLGRLIAFLARLPWKSWFLPGKLS